MNKYYLIKDFYSKRYVVNPYRDDYEVGGTKQSACKFSSIEEAERVITLFQDSHFTFEIKTIYV